MFAASNTVKNISNTQQSNWTEMFWHFTSSVCHAHLHVDAVLFFSGKDATLWCRAVVNRAGHLKLPWNKDGYSASRCEKNKQIVSGRYLNVQHQPHLQATLMNEECLYSFHNNMTLRTHFSPAPVLTKGRDQLMLQFTIRVRRAFTARYILAKLQR